jgi:Condensation domain
MYDSVNAVMEAFDIFKITFEWNHASEFLQTRLHRRSNVLVEMQEIESGDDGMSVVRSVCRKDYRTLFDMTRRPLARFRIFTSVSKHCYLYYNIHHILVDEWTCEMLMDAILKEYHGTSWQNTTHASWGSPITVWESQSCKEEALADWKLRLAGITPFDTHSWPEGACEAKDRSPGSTSLLRFSRQNVHILQKRLERDGLGLFTALLSAFQALLH